MSQLQNIKLPDNFLSGFLLGLCGPVFGLFTYAFFYTLRYGDMTILYFIQEIFLRYPVTQAPILAISLLFNGLLFYLFINRENNKSAMGVVVATVLYAPAVIYLRFSTLGVGF